MAFVAAPNIMQIELRSTLGGEQVENRIYVNALHEPTVADMNAVATPIAEAILANWVPLMPVTWIMREIFIKSLHAQNAPQATYPQAAGLFTGTNAFQQLPNNCTVCVSLRSNFTGRSARGRLFWQALSENQVDGNLLTTAAASSILAAVQSIDAAIAGVGMDWQIVSFITNGAPRVGGPVYFSVNGILLVDNVVDSQRGRLPGRGN